MLVSLHKIFLMTRVDLNIFRCDIAHIHRHIAHTVEDEWDIFQSLPSWVECNIFVLERERENKDGVSVSLLHSACAVLPFRFPTPVILLNFYPSHFGAETREWKYRSKEKINYTPVYVKFVAK